MQLRIAHTTGFEYDGKANTSFNEARLTPLTTPGQIVVHTRVEVHPTPWAYTYRDYWGTQVTAFEVLDPHESLTVTAIGDGAHRPRRRAGAHDELGRHAQRPVTADRAHRVPRPARAGSRPPRTWSTLAREIADASANARRRRRARSARSSTARSSTSPAPPTVDAFAAALLGRAERRVPGHGAPRDRRPALGRHPGPLRLRLPAPQKPTPRRRAGQRRVARLGRVVGRRLARLRPDQRHRGRRPPRRRRHRPRLRRREAARAGSSPAAAPATCSSTSRSPACSSRLRAARRAARGRPSRWHRCIRRGRASRR